MEPQFLDDQFNCLAIKFIFVCESSSELNSLLIDLNGLDYKSQRIQNTDSIVQFLDSIPKISVKSDPNIIVKTCHLIKQLINKQKIFLPEQVSSKVIQWILNCCDQKSCNLFFCEAIDALSVLFKINSYAAVQHSSKLLSTNGILMKFISKNSTENAQKSFVHENTPQELYKSTLGCLEAILMCLTENDEEVDGMSNEHVQLIGKSIINLMFALRQEAFPEVDMIMIATSSLNCLKFIIQMDSEFANENVGELLGIAKSFMLFSIPDITQSAPSKIASSQQAIMEPLAIRPPNKRGGGLTNKSRKGKKHNKKSSTKQNLNKQEDSSRTYGFKDNQSSFCLNSEFPAYRTSDSDYSDNEHNRESINRHKQNKLRVASLSMLSAIAGNVEKKILFGYWHSLLSTEETSSATLVNSILKDSSPRCRILALQAIIQLLKNSKPFLIQAENKDKAPSTFTPFAVTLGNMIVFTYEKLTQALIKEGDLTVLAQILKCISILIPATPFHRLRSGIVTGFVKYVRLLVRHKDPTIKVAALIVMGNLISIPDMTSEIYELVEIPKTKLEFSWKIIDEGIRTASGITSQDEFVDLEFDDEEVEIEVEDDKKEELIKMSWLLQTVLENLGVFNGCVLKIPSPATSVRIESLQILSAMTSHFLLLKDHLNSIAMALITSLKSVQLDEKNYASRTLDFVGSSINLYLSKDKKNIQDLDAAIEFWLSIIPSVVERIQDLTQPPLLRASLADSLANIGVHVFEKLEHQKQILLISILTGCSYDEDSNVKSSAIRALAVYALFPSLRDDLCFIENTIESILRIIKDENIVTRTKASWSLGNVVDALLMIRDDNHTINERLFREIFVSTIDATNDNDRVKVNAVRMLGNLLTLLTSDQLNDQSWSKVFNESILKLHDLLLNCSNVKVKWNICYAFSSLMKISRFFELKLKWTSLVFPALCNVIKTSPNFKVRINASAAFTIPSRENFGGHFIDIWSCLLDALEQSNNLTDFNEYKHRDTLQDQLCLSISHVISVATIDDIVSMKNEVFPLIDITKQNWNRVFNRCLPECQGKILTAIEVLKTIECKTSEQKNSIEILLSCFEPIEKF
ncbi:CLUMA_CG016347, isoform A [Clunio marinus]|uniref:HEAT repeat-containing protein 6 n=1 Tax=Clunio marinus TaxID=568069 RepID=A0A1J1ITS3_9DIPT|nr:CLUMA_CG016347, isoform A [Clunio marinus]